MLDEEQWEARYADLENILDDVVAELDRMRAVAVAAGACRCSWDLDEDRDGAVHDVISHRHPECPIHVATGKQRH